MVINWFASDVNLDQIKIYPAVEYKGEVIHSPDQWNVGKWTRQTAQQITLDENNNPMVEPQAISL